jgi:hypothetical protein
LFVSTPAPTSITMLPRLSLSAVAVVVVAVMVLNAGWVASEVHKIAVRDATSASNSYVYNALYALHQHNNPSVSELVEINTNTAAYVPCPFAQRIRLLPIPTRLRCTRTQVLVPSSPTGLYGSDAFFAQSAGIFDSNKKRYACLQPTRQP